jgi:NAD(P)H dehydrogenase (quinone)
MSRILIFYFSKTGNTEKMAKAVAEGAGMIEGVEVEIKYQLRPKNWLVSTQ